jgi:polyhydroxyalkanoate synthesis regulator phasin
MKSIRFLSFLLAGLLLFGLKISAVYAVSLPEIPKEVPKEIPKPSMPSFPSIPSLPSPAGPAFAPTSPVTPENIDQRIENQGKRIEANVKSKRLTQAEATTLKENLTYIKQRQKRLSKDGSLSPKDTEWLSILLDRNGRMFDGKKTEPVKPMKDVYYEMRFEQHQKWMDQGIASGELTKEEAKEVKDDLEKIKAAYARASKDGKLDSDERERLDERLSHNTRMIEKRKK